MSVGPPRWTWRSMSSTACWNSDARTMSASPNLDGAGVNAPAPLIRATQPPRRKFRPLWLKARAQTHQLGLLKGLTHAPDEIRSQAEWYNSDLVLPARGQIR